MGRLIDADVLEKKLDAILCEPDYQHTGENWSVGVCIAQTAIYDVPTAYDVESVVEELEQMLESLSDCGDDWFTAEKINDAIEIVRKGGNKDD